MKLFPNGSIIAFGLLQQQEVGYLNLFSDLDLNTGNMLDKKCDAFIQSLLPRLFFMIYETHSLVDLLRCLPATSNNLACDPAEQLG